MAEATTYVYDATDKVLGRLASETAKVLLSGKRAGRDDRVIIVNCEHAIISGKRSRILSDYRTKYELNHARKGPFFPRMPDQILKRSVRGMLPYQKNSTGRNAVRALRVMIGVPYELSKDELPDGHEWADLSNIDRPLPDRFVRLGDVSMALGIDGSRWGGVQ